ncbi:Uncharacterized protein Adt_03287 [Abeliophyllum distichum]|uniref:Uncharacterized protein n=1 Tax=Abeliophyllum distichum TaxID=126358 RepID=A0ABD1VY27_9LAMI
MIDIGSIHNYFASTEVECIGLVLEKDSRKFKAIYLSAQPIVEVAKYVLIKDGPFVDSLDGQLQIDFGIGVFFSFLGYIIEQGKVRIDVKKIMAIKDWQSLKHIYDVCLFPELASYYQRFVKGYSEIATTDRINKEGKSLGLVNTIQGRFRETEEAYVDGFGVEVQMDALNFALGGVLIQE